MSASRLSLAVHEHGLPVPAAAVVNVYRARTSFDYAPFQGVDLKLYQSFRPEFDALKAAGFDVAPDADRPADVHLVQITRAKAETMGLVAKAVRLSKRGGLVIVDGSKTDGIESILKRLKGAFQTSEPIAKSHGKLFWFNVPENVPEAVIAWEADAAATHSPEGFQTAPGMFSHGKIDPGSTLLAEHMKALPGGRIADLGAGWGYLSHHALKATDISELHLFEAEKMALDAAEANITDPRAQFHWADVLSLGDMEFDAVISNPPFHQSRAADPALGKAFIAKAAEILTPTGQFLMVANRHLPYEKDLAAHFVRIETLAETHHFKVFHASRPTRNSRNPERIPLGSTGKRASKD